MLRRVFASLLVVGAAAAAQDIRLQYPQRDDVRIFIDEAVAAYGLEREFVEQALAQGRYSSEAERLMTPSLAPPGARNWREYRMRMFDEKRLREGLAFWRANRATLARASQQYGVPESVIVAILGVETLFGRMTGSFRTLDVLLTLSFDYTRRAPYYREELAHFLVLCRDQGLDPTAQRGSFAGAMGLPQFMPGSVRRYAVDYDGDGRVDLGRSPADAIGSIANFLYMHGWQRDLPIALPARADGEVMETLGRGIRAAYRWRHVAALGVTIDSALDGDANVFVIDLPFVSAAGAEGVEYRLGTENLAALLRYNRSYFYAAAVAELAEALNSRIGPMAAASGVPRATALR